MRKVRNDRPKRLKIASSAAFANKNVHAKLRFVTRFVQCGAFVITADSCSDVALCIISAQARRVTINEFPNALGSFNLGDDLRITMKHAGPIHHLGEVSQAWITEEPRDICRIQPRARSFKLSGRHATRHAKRNRHAGMLRLRQHVLNASFAEHITDLMRIAHSCNSAVAHRDAREFLRRQHAAFDMHMRIYEPWNEIPRINCRVRRKFNN